MRLKSITLHWDIELLSLVAGVVIVTFGYIRIVEYLIL